MHISCPSQGPLSFIYSLFTPSTAPFWEDQDPTLELEPPRWAVSLSVRPGGAGTQMNIFMPSSLPPGKGSAGAMEQQASLPFLRNHLNPRQPSRLDASQQFCMCLLGVILTADL